MTTPALKCKTMENRAHTLPGLQGIDDEQGPLVRQIGDAINSGRPLDALLYRLIELRRHELR